MNNLKNLIVGSLMAAAATAHASVTFVELDKGDNIFQDTRWTRDNVYILTDIINVLPPATLTIEPGTIIRGIPKNNGFRPDIDSEKEGIQDEATSSGGLAVARGAKLIANGTADDPIVFTSINDPYVPGGLATAPTTVLGVSVASTPVGVRNYNTDGPTGDNAFTQEILWGGVVLCGEAPIGVDRDDDNVFHPVNNPNPRILQYDPVTNKFSGDDIKFPSGVFDGQGEHSSAGAGTGMAVIEGMPEVYVELPKDSSYSDDAVFGLPEGTVIDSPANNLVGPAVYGGLNRDDNSGVVRFVSNRYGGFIVGVGNEINGLTVGAMGTGTVVDWCETYNNADDAFEWFGGFNVNTNLFCLFVGDDGLDGDQGFSGIIQNALILRDNGGLRAGYGNDTVTGKATANRSDKGGEWDGSESNNFGVTPNTDQFVYNFAIMGGASGTGRQGIDSKESCEGRWGNGIFESFESQAWRIDAPNPAIGPEYGSNVYYNTGVNGTQSSKTPSTQLPGEQEYLESVSQFVNFPVYTTGSAITPLLEKGTWDLRLAFGSRAADIQSFNAPADRDDIYAFSNWYKLPFAGAMRDSNKLIGWSILDYLGLIVSDTVTRPKVSIALNSSAQPVVTFNAEPGVGGRAVLYTVEKSVNGKVWIPIATVSDNDGAGLTSKSGATFAVNDANADAGMISVVDTTTTISTGNSVSYRVTPQ